MNHEKCGVVDVGGGWRGIYACGVLDRCMEDGIDFDVAIGVSAGSANLASYTSRQLGRNYRFYTAYGMRPQYAGLRNLILKHTFIDMDYVYSTLSNTDGEDPLDYEAFKASPTSFYAVAANAETGEVKYFSEDDIHEDDYDVMKASCAIPGVCHPYLVDGEWYFDGALGDPVPVQKAFDLGCQKVVLILTRPVDQIREVGSDQTLAKLIQRKYPHASEKLLKRADMYNSSVELAKELERERKVLIVSPDDTCGVSTLTRDRDKLDALYAKGYADGAEVVKFIKG